MKMLLLILALCSTINSQDYYNGTFEQSNHKETMWWEYDTFSFYNDSLFEFYRWTDYGGKYGKGVYKVTDTTLTLYFQNIIDQKIQSRYVVDNTSGISDNFIKYSIKVMDINGEPIYGAILSLKNKSDSLISDSRSTLYYETDKYGISNIIINKIYLPLTLNIGYIAKQRIKIDLSENLNKEISVFLAGNNQTYFKADDSLTYLIKKVNDNKFYLKRPEIKYWLLHKKTNNKFTIPDF